LSQEVFDDAVREDIFNSISLCIVSLTLLFELLLLFCLFLEGKSRATPADAEATRDTAPEAITDPRDGTHYATVLRTVFFLFILALDMSITFIPLRMAELPTTFLGLSRDVVLGLPVSAEVAMAGIAIFLTGRWIGRYGAALLMSVGFMLAAAGYVGSAMVSGPLGFILARAMAGAGYGMSIMAAQAYVFRSGGLAGLFAGVFAGSLCGGAIGSMLAEKMGFSAAFYASSGIMLLLVVLPYILLRHGDTCMVESAPAQADPSGQAGQRAQKGLGRTLKALFSGQFMALSLFALIPATFIVLGFNKYFMPIYLNRAGIGQADIGRVYMVYCLVLIYLGPPLGKLVLRARHKAPAVTLGCFLGALSILILAIFDSLGAMLLCSFMLGLATAFNIPAHAEYLLKLDITSQLGSNQALGMLNVVERVGQAAAPIALGLLMTAFAVHNIALWGGLFLLLLTVAFYVTRVQE
jgi:MFS family permease